VGECAFFNDLRGVYLLCGGVTVGGRTLAGNRS
jgi:hypothetical protein